ncbi:hypothetical protein SAMD00024442_11_53 [Candidatus Symbiothrix dinenymphae]|nr:hypothetical protein SAMD00024442_11_53 [Candidatus Symbiothrix dinenymphae]
MKQKINTQLETIEKSIKWVKETDSMRGAKGETAYRNFVNFRRKLNKKKYALEGNPAAAMYGESQVGKSYLISSLLSEEGKPFNIVDENNVVHNFIEEINPPGGGSESTSLVSRFSVSYKPVNQKFPVKAVLLSPADIALVLCDSFYSDVKANHDLLLKSEDINAEIYSLKDKLQGRQPQQTVFGEDDVLDMQDYFKDNLPKAGEVLSSNFFAEASLLISKSQPEEWKDIFSLLWNKNEKITTLFAKLIAEYEKLNFADNVYLPLESVLYKHGTLLDVKRLKEIYFEPDRIESDYRAETKVLLLNNGTKREITVAKSYLCTLSAELVFSQPETLLASKPFLKETDLLDFPGARSRLTLPEIEIKTEIIPELLLRGKVAYLFNKYSEYEKINILLFCSKHDQPGQRAMPEMLNSWINKIVGETSDKRADFISKSKVPPLFIIGTFFNVNLQYDPQRDKPNDNTHFNYRWNQRFDTTLAAQMLNTKIYSWFEDWTTVQPYFQNIFLLRDFEKSESISHIFTGYNANKKELTEVIPDNYPDFKAKLRQSFINYDFVKRHFENPAESWDRAASINEDGTQLIIEKLTIAANNINEARREKSIRELNDIAKGIVDELNKYFHDSDSDALLQRAKSTAGSIQANLDITFGQNPYFFGNMMHELMLPQSAVYKFYLEKIRDIERRDVVNMDKYSAIRMNVPELNPNDNFDTNLEHLRVHYEKQTNEECQTYFETEGIDLEELFYGNNERVKQFSQVLADALETYWFEQYMLENRQNLSKVFSETGLQDIQEMLRSLFQKLQIAKILAERIRRYVDGYRNIEEVYEMIADISAELINKFINTIGLEYFSESDFADLKQANDKNSLGLVLEHNELQFEQNSREEAAELITKMGNLPELLNQNPLPQDAKRLPNYRNYIVWYDLLKVGFIFVCNIPNYDVQANNRLKVIIDECKTLKYESLCQQ